MGIDTLETPKCIKATVTCLPAAWSCCVTLSCPREGVTETVSTESYVYNPYVSNITLWQKEHVAA